MGIDQFILTNFPFSLIFPPIFSTFFSFKRYFIEVHYVIRLETMSQSKCLVKSSHTHTHTHTIKMITKIVKKHSNIAFEK